MTHIRTLEEIADGLNSTAETIDSQFCAHCVDSSADEIRAVVALMRNTQKALTEADVRKAFETWHEEEYPHDSLLRHIAGHYALDNVNNRWKAAWNVHLVITSSQPSAAKESA